MNELHDPDPPGTRPEGPGRRRHAPDPLGRSVEAAVVEAEEERRVVRFGVAWRAFIRDQGPDRLAALDALIDDRIERQALAGFYRRVRQAAVAAVIAGFAVAEFGIDRLPIVRQVWRLLRGDVR